MDKGFKLCYTLQTGKRVEQKVWEVERLFCQGEEWIPIHGQIAHRCADNEDKRQSWDVSTLWTGGKWSQKDLNSIGSSVPQSHTRYLLRTDFFVRNPNMHPVLEKRKSNQPQKRLEITKTRKPSKPFFQRSRISPLNRNTKSKAIPKCSTIAFSVIEKGIKQQAYEAVYVPQQYVDIYSQIGKFLHAGWLTKWPLHYILFLDMYCILQYNMHLLFCKLLLQHFSATLKLQTIILWLVFCQKPPMYNNTISMWTMIALHANAKKWPLYKVHKEV